MGAPNRDRSKTKQAALAAKAGDPASKAEKAAKATKAKKAKEPKDKKVSAIDAAAQVLSANKEPMNAKELIEANGRQEALDEPRRQNAPGNTFSALIREMAAKGKEAHFLLSKRNGEVRRQVGGQERPRDRPGRPETASFRRLAGRAALASGRDVANPLVAVSSRNRHLVCYLKATQVVVRLRLALSLVVWNADCRRSSQISLAGVYRKGIMHGQGRPLV
jgi:hypothetical protein